MPVDPQLVEALRTRCAGAPWAGEVFAPAEANLDREPIVQADAVRLAGRVFTHVATRFAGMGRWMSWTWTNWLVEPDTCRAVGLAEDGAAESIEALACFRAMTPSPEERAWLLDHSGYAPWDPARAGQALATAAWAPGVSGPREEVWRSEGVTVTRVRGPEPRWYPAPVPAFSVAWRPVEGEGTECFAVHHGESLGVGSGGASWVVPPVADPEKQGNTWIRVLRNANRVTTMSTLLATPERWTVSEPQAVSEGSFRDPPSALTAWRWSEQSGFADPGERAVVATDLASGRRTTFELDPPAESVRWVATGLEVTPFEGSTVVVVPVEALRP